MVKNKTETHSKMEISKKPKAAAAAAAAILDAMVDGVAVVDINGNYVQVNKSLLKMYGCKSQKEIIGKPIFKFILKKDIPKVMKRFMTFVRNKEQVIINLDFTGLTKQGKGFPVLLNGTVLKDPKGKLVGLLGVMRDISELKKLQESEKAAAAAAAAAETAKLEEIKKSQEEIKLFSDAVASSINAVAMTDMNGKHTYVNSSWEKMFGYSFKEATQLIIPQMVSKEELGKLTKEIMPSLMKKRGYTGELIVLRKDKTKFPVSFSASLIKDDKGKPIAMMGSFIDITELKKAQEKIQVAAAQTAKLEEIKKSQEEIASAWQYSENVVANIPSMLLVFDDKLKCTSANWTYYNTFQKKPEHIIGNHVSHAVPSGLITDYHLDKKIIEVLKTGKAVELPRCVYHNHHEKIFNIKIVKGKAAAAAAAAFVMIVIDDVTEKAKAEKALAKSKKELEDKVADLQSFSDIAVGRELKMVELKKQIKKLQEQLAK